MTPDRTTPPRVRPFGELTMPPETIETLDNGITFHHLRGGDQPVCSLTIAFDGGISELGEAGVRTMLGMLTEQTAHHTADEVSEIIDFNGARISGQAMSHHSALKTVTLTKNLPDLLPLIGEMIAEPAFDAARLEVAKAKAISNLQTAHMDTSVLADEAAAQLVWGENNPLARITTEDDYAVLSPSALADVHRRIVAPSHAHAYFSGLFSDSTLDAVQNALAAIPALGAGTDVMLVPATPAPPGTVREVAFDKSLQSAISIAIPTIHRSHPDYIPLRLTIMALGGYFGSRLMTNIREEKGLTYGINAALLGELQGSFIGISAKCDRRFTDTVLHEISEELRKLAADPPAGEELERLRIYASTSLAKILDTPSGCMQYYQNIRFTGTPNDYFRQQLRHIAALTPDVISEMAKKYLSSGYLTAIAGR